ARNGARRSDLPGLDRLHAPASGRSARAVPRARRRALARVPVRRRAIRAAELRNSARSLGRCARPDGLGGLEHALEMRIGDAEYVHVLERPANVFGAAPALTDALRDESR